MAVYNGGKEYATSSQHQIETWVQRGGTCTWSSYPGHICRELPISCELQKSYGVVAYCPHHSDPANRRTDPGIFTARNDPRGRR